MMTRSSAKEPFEHQHRRLPAPYLLIAPAILFLLLFSLYPLLSGIWYSFTGIGWVGAKAHFVGVDNYVKLLGGQLSDSRLVKGALARSFIWTASVVAGQLVMGFLAALVLNERFRGRAFFRTAILAPIAVPTVIIALTWQWMYDPLYGLINHYLHDVGLIHGPKTWILQPDAPIWPLVVVGIWTGFPFMALMLLSGLQGIQGELYEAAKVDGANQVQRFRYITVPQLRTVITIAVMLSTLWWWNQFEIPMILRGGPNQVGNVPVTLPILSWFEAFRWSHLNLGAVVATMSMIILAGIIVWNARRELRSVHR